MARMTRKELRQDEVAEAAHDAGEWLEHNWRKALIYLGVVVAVVLGTWGAVAAVRAGAEKKRMAVAHGVDLYVDAAESSFTDVGALSESLDTLEKIAAPGDSGPGAVAGYYRALALRRLGRTNEAVEALEEMLSTPGGNTTLSGSATLLLGGLYVEVDRVDDAVKLYEDVADSGSQAFPAEEALLLVGQLHERQGDDGAAREVWERIRDDFPQTRAATEAQRKLAAS